MWIKTENESPSRSEWPFFQSKKAIEGTDTLNLGVARHPRIVANPSFGGEISKYLDQRGGFKLLVSPFRVRFEQADFGHYLDDRADRIVLWESTGEASPRFELFHRTKKIWFAAASRQSFDRNLVSFLWSRRVSPTSIYCLLAVSTRSNTSFPALVSRFSIWNTVEWFETSRVNNLQKTQTKKKIFKISKNI